MLFKLFCNLGIICKLQIQSPFARNTCQKRLSVKIGDKYQEEQDTTVFIAA